MKSTLRINSNIIAVAGLKDAGKSSVASMLEYLLNTPRIARNYYCYKIFKKGPGRGYTTSFAKPLKQNLSTLLNKPLDWFEDRYNKENMFVRLDTLRIIDRFLLGDDDVLTENKFSKLIKTGNPFPEGTFLSIRQLMQYYGTEVCRHYLGDKTGINATLNNTHKHLIISDLRFKAEYQEIKSREGIIIYIKRKSAIPGSHASEREVLELEKDGFDYIVNNDGTLEDLFNNLKEILGRR